MTRASKAPPKRPRKRCGAPDMIGRCHCEREPDHPGQHWIIEGGRVFRWGSNGGADDEATRTGAQVKLRLAPALHALLDDLAARAGTTRSALVARWIVTAAAGQIDRDPQIDHCALPGQRYSVYQTMGQTPPTRR